MREEKGEETLKPLLTACRQDRKAQEGGGGVGWGIKSSNGQTQNMRQMEKMKLNP